MTWTVTVTARTCQAAAAAGAAPGVEEGADTATGRQRLLMQGTHWNTPYTVSESESGSDL